MRGWKTGILLLVVLSALFAGCQGSGTPIDGDRDVTDPETTEADEAVAGDGDIDIDERTEAEQELCPPAIEAPDERSLPEIGVGMLLDVEIELLNAGCADLVINTLRLEEEPLADLSFVSPLELPLVIPALAMAVIEVRVEPVADPCVYGSLEIDSNDPIRPHVSVPFRPVRCCGLDGDEEGCCDGDVVPDGDGEGDLESGRDALVDGDALPHTGPSCDEMSMIAPSTEPQAVAGATRACRDYYAIYADPEIAAFHTYLLQTCQPVEVSFGEYGRAVVCEVAHRDGDLPTDNPSWPGPGYGCVWGPNIGDVITGWYGGVGGYSGQENTCHERWTEGTWAFVLDRQPRDPTPCSTIGDLRTCLHTHNHPYHCQPQFGWDLVWDGSVCEVREMSSFTGDELNAARFIGCRTVHEFYFDREVERGCRPYTGPILNLTTGECLGYDYRECAIPAGWRKAACGECSRPADGDGEAE